MKLRNLDLDLLRTFCKIIDTGGFTAASDHLHITQSTVSVHMARLEEFVGYRLIDRQRGAVILTEHGEVLLSYARRILAINDETIFRMSDFEIKGMLRLGVVEYLAPHRVPAILSRLRATFPKLDLRLKIDLSGSLLRELEEGKLDVVIAARSEANQGGVNLLEEQLFWAAHHDFRLEADKPLPLALLPPPCFYREAAISALNSIGRSWVGAVTTMNVGGVQAAVSAGLAVGVLSQSSLLPNIRRMGETEGFPALPKFNIALFTGQGDVSLDVKPIVEFIMAEISNLSV
ncbi:LysR family transcriptional regulator [Sapientia aquatica]|nr:LysR substrate-binding domain-containing protein [Sapientia aquatica]